MELLLAAWKELLGAVEPRLLPALLAVLAAGLTLYHVFGIPALKRRLDALEARVPSALQVARVERKQDALAQGIKHIGEWLGRGGEALAWHLTYTAAGIVSPEGERQARAWEKKAGDQV